MTSQSYPAQDYLTAGPQYGYQFDAMGRTNGMTGPPWNLTIATAAYGPAGELTSLNGDTRTYNTLGQLTRISGGGIDLEYVYTAGQNNGRITQQIDHVSGEQVTYQYDQLNRLSHAETLDNSWGLSYGYDGFGNLTAKTVTKGTAIPGWTGFTVAYDPATNHGNAYDANGNASVGGVYPYDVENRLTATIRSPAQGEYYGSDGSYVYDPWGKRVGWRFPRSTGIAGSDPETKCEVHFYGITGQKLASYSCGYHDAEGGDGTFYWSLKGYNVYFAGHLVQSNGVSVTTDRLGSVRANGSGERFNYLPHGEERTPTADGREKFATYIRDSGGLDYADQRYYDRGSGRFLTADPGGISTADPRDPGSWNRFAYVGGDPVNFVDPSGTNRLMCDVYTDYGCAGTGTAFSGGGWYLNLINEAGEGWSYSSSGFLPSSGGAGDPQGGSGSSAPVATNWQLMPAAFSRAMQALTLNQDCFNLFGNSTSRAGKWDPTVVLTSLFLTQDGSYGSVNFNYTGNGSALTTPTGFPLPSLRSGITGTSATISLNAKDWNVNNVAFNAETLLHEMGHLYNFVRGAGGFAVPNRAELKDKEAFDKVIEDKCSLKY